jgi:hypothetical protein
MQERNNAGHPPSTVRPQRIGRAPNRVWLPAEIREPAVAPARPRQGARCTEDQVINPKKSNLLPFRFSTDDVRLQDSTNTLRARLLKK